MKKIRVVAAIACCWTTLSMFSCTDFVDLKYPTIVGQDQYYNTQSDFQAAVNGLYASLRPVYNDFHTLAELPSDNTQANDYTLGLLSLDQMTWLDNNTNIQNLWLNSYRVIGQANTILGRINAVSMDENVKARFIAEAKFIRALMYFNLVRFFGDVPLVVNEIKTEAEAYGYLRESVQVVYDQIELDLTDAIAILPSVGQVENDGRATKGAAQGLLGTVYVAQRSFEEALPILAELIGDGHYKLLDDYEALFLAPNKNNEEMLFSIQYHSNGNAEGSNFSILFAPFGSGTEITSGGNPAQVNEGTQDLWDAFEEGDARKPVAIAKYSPTGVYYTRKFLDKPTANYEANNNWPVLRYADVKLLYAETLNELGRGSDAMDELNDVRRRADLDGLSGLGQAALRDAIQRERRVELCFEGHRWFDLLRTGNMVDVMSAYKEKGVGYQVDSYEVDSYKVLLPIPFRERSLNPKLTQNNGYE